MRRPAPSASPPATVHAAVAPPCASVDYPESDGKRMAENDAQLAAILYGISVLRTYYAHRRDVYVSGDLLVYYEEGDPRASVAPDVFVVFGVEDRERMTYRVWEEGKGPDFVLEVASRSTWREDVGAKRGVYARMGVGEYWLYDPLGEYLRPRLRGYRLVGGRYERQPLLESLDGRLTLCSGTLGLDLWVKGREMRFRDPVTGLDLLGHREEHIARRSAEVRAEREAVMRQAAEARVAELEALIGGKRD